MARSTPTSERAARPPLSSVREAPFNLVRDADGDGEPNDGLTLDGYGAVFNRETIIDSWEGRFREQIAGGAMKKSFRETPPKIQFDHGRHPMIGSIPIARLEHIAEEVDPELAPDGGAHIIGRVFDNWLMSPVRDAIAGGAVDGMSFRFEVMREQWQMSDGTVIRDTSKLMQELERTWYEDVPDEELLLRTLQQLKVPEMGPVTWPAYTDTAVSMRNTIIDLGRLHEPEQRRMLATAVFLAEAAEQQDSQRDTAQAVEHQSDSSESSSPAGSADTVKAVPHPPVDAQRSTDAKSSAGEHPSNPRGHRPIDLWVGKSRDVLLNIQAKKGATP